MHVSLSGVAALSSRLHMPRPRARNALSLVSDHRRFFLQPTHSYQPHARPKPPIIPLQMQYLYVTYRPAVSEGLTMRTTCPR